MDGLPETIRELTLEKLPNRSSVAMTRSMAHHPEVQHQVSEMRIALDASEVTLVAPYLVYTRQDQRSQSGKTVSSKCFSRLVSSTFDRLVTVAPHLHQYSALHSIPSHTPYAVPLLAHWIAAEIEERLIIRPNEESVQWVLEFARRIGAPNVLLRKIRHGDRNLDVERPELPHYARSSQGIIEVEILS